MNEVLIPNAGEYKITRHLPKTGQTVSYMVNDDGQHERGWWRGRLNSNNKQRFLCPGTTVTDRATGLMWPSNCIGLGGNNGNPVATWAGAILWAEALTFAGFTDWHLPNIYELHSILNFGAIPGWYQPEFINVINNYYWSSTTYPAGTGSAMCLRFQFYVTGVFSKTAPGANIYVLAVRETAL